MGKLSQKLEYRGYIMTVTAMQFADDFATTRKAREGYKLVAVEVQVESGLNKGVHFSPAHTRLLDGSRREYKPRATGKTPVLQEAFDIPKGASVRGWLTFEVPAGVRVLTFENELPQTFGYVVLQVRLAE
jgi:hypothetical protein